MKFLRKKKIVCVIPARLQSTRLEKKMLSMIGGKPMLQWIWETATSFELFDDVVFAIDSPITMNWIAQFGGKTILTSETCESGTERLCEIMEKGLVRADIWVNWQGDEPFISHEMLHDLLSIQEDSFDVVTLKKEVSNVKEALDPSIVKVVCTTRGYAMYFSRSLIPFIRNPHQAVKYYKHIGLYAYSKEALAKISTYPKAPLAQVESLEQLSFLDAGLKILVHETKYDNLSIDTKDDLQQAKKMAEKLSYQS